MKTIRMKFTTAVGKPYSFSLNYADPALDSAEGRMLVQDAADAIMRAQPFGVALAKFDGAELIDRTVTAVL